MSDARSTKDAPRWLWLSETAKKAVVRFLFPDFSNKLTWYVVAVGMALILTPELMQFLLVEWIIKTFSLSVGGSLTIADFAANNADYWTGFGLITVSLLHNLGNKWIAAGSADDQFQGHTQRESSDLALYRELTLLLPSNSPSVRMLVEHDFGNSFNTNRFDALDHFVDEWNCPERTFQRQELEAARKDLWECAKSFVTLLAMKSCPTSGGLQSVVPDKHRSDWDWPAWVAADVMAVNEAANKVYKEHQTFLSLGKQILKC